MMTERQKQASKTRTKIFKTAVMLMQKQGIEKTTIENICKKAHVSVGSFYNYFHSKYDIIVKVFESADMHFSTVVAPELESLNPVEKLLRFIRHYARYDVQQGLDFTRSLYSNSDCKLFVNRNRFMHIMVYNILVEGQEAHIFKPDLNADEMGEFIFIIARGIVNDWCLHDADYDLEQKMVYLFEKFLPVLLA